MIRQEPPLSTVTVRESQVVTDKPYFSKFELFSTFVNPVIIIESDKSVYYINPAFEKLTGFTQKEVAGLKPPYPWWLEENYERYGVLLRTYMRAGVHQYEHVFQNCCGDKFWVAITLTPIEYDEQVKFYVIQWVDISRQVIRNQRITGEIYQQEKKLRRSLEQEKTRREHFFRMLVHELKTPLTATLFSSELLCRELDKEPFLSLAKNIHRSVTDLNENIDGLMDLAKGEMKRMKLNLRLADLLVTLQEIAKEAGVVATHDGKTFTIEVPSSLPRVKCDENRIRQTLQNLLNNALKYTRKGDSICLRARIQKENLLIEVEDSGLGISEQRQRHLFQTYYGSGTATKSGGLGLGLSLCKMLVELHKGKIWVESEYGHGSKFCFTLPLKPNNKTASIAKS